MDREQQTRPLSDSASMLAQLLARRDKYNLSTTDVVSIMTDLVIGGVDTVSCRAVFGRVYSESNALLCLDVDSHALFAVRVGREPVRAGEAARGSAQAPER